MQQEWKTTYTRSERSHLTLKPVPRRGSSKKRKEEKAKEQELGTKARHKIRTVEMKAKNYRPKDCPYKAYKAIGSMQERKNER